jgi:hypothetical protein
VSEDQRAMAQERQDLEAVEKIWRVWGLAKPGGPVLVAPRLIEVARKHGYPVERCRGLEGGQA